MRAPVRVPGHADDRPSRPRSHRIGLDTGLNAGTDCVDVPAREDTFRAAGEPLAGAGEGRRLVEVDRACVKGKHHSVTLFTRGVIPAERAGPFDEEMRLSQLALASCRLQHRHETQTRLQGLQTAFADTPFAGPYRQLGERTDRYRATPPPAHWHGGSHLRQPMILQVLGCSGSIAAGCKTTAFLLDGDVLIDAGTGVGDLELEALARIDHILISHSHLDHVLSIGLLADGVMRVRSAAGRGPIRVHALPETLAALRTHIFNGVIWPDFTRLPSAQQPVLELVPFGVGDVLELNGKRIEVLSASHTVPAVGFAVECATGPSDMSTEPVWWVYTGDTGPNPLLWERLRRMKVAHLIIETAFSDEERQLARVSRHLCPSALGHELAQLAGSVDVHITHIKPGEMEAVMTQIGALGTGHRVRALAAGQVMDLGGDSLHAASQQ